MPEAVTLWPRLRRRTGGKRVATTSRRSSGGRITRPRRSPIATPEPEQAPTACSVPEESKEAKAAPWGTSGRRLRSGGAFRFPTRTAMPGPGRLLCKWGWGPGVGTGGGDRRINHTTGVRRAQRCSEWLAQASTQGGKGEGCSKGRSRGGVLSPLKPPCCRWLRAMLRTLSLLPAIRWRAIAFASSTTASLGCGPLLLPAKPPAKPRLRSSSKVTSRSSGGEGRGGADCCAMAVCET